MKTGWVFEIKKKMGYYSKDYAFDISGSPITKKLSRAIVAPTRSFARSVKFPEEVLRKVELNKNNEPKRVIKGR